MIMFLIKIPGSGYLVDVCANNYRTNEDIESGCPVHTVDDFNIIYEELKKRFDIKCEMVKVDRITKEIQ